MKYNVTTESPTNLTKELGIDNLEASEGLEEPSLRILHWAEPLGSNCSPLSNSRRFEIGHLYSTILRTKHTSLLSSHLTVRDALTVLYMVIELLFVETTFIKNFCMWIIGFVISRVTVYIKCVPRRVFLTLIFKLQPNQLPISFSFSFCFTCTLRLSSEGQLVI